MLYAVTLLQDSAFTAANEKPEFLFFIKSPASTLTYKGPVIVKI